MNYLQLINAYWQYTRLRPLSPLTSCFYLALLDECNRQYWPESFEVPPRFAKDVLQRSYNTIGEVRQRLIDHGFITYEVIDGIGRYSIIDRTIEDATSKSLPTPKQPTSEPKPLPKPEPKPLPKPEPKPEHYENSNHTSYIENKNKNKTLSLSSENAKERKKVNLNFDSDSSEYGSDASSVADNPTSRNPPRPSKFKVRDPESTFWECRQSAKSKEYTNFLKFLEESAPYVASHLTTLSEEQFFILRDAFGPTMIGRVVTNLENRQDLCSRYSHMYYTIKNWCLNEQQRTQV